MFSIFIILSFVFESRTRGNSNLDFYNNEKLRSYLFLSKIFLGVSPSFFGNRRTAGLNSTFQHYYASFTFDMTEIIYRMNK